MPNRNDSAVRKAVPDIPNVDNLTLCSVKYSRMDIRISDVQLTYFTCYCGY